MRIFTAILFCTQFLIGAGQYRFDHLTVNDGLSQNSINDILQDSDGFMWFATQDGLNRFDGYEFTRYMTDGALTVSDNFLWDLTEDDEGNIWSASRNGASRLNWKEGKSTHFYRSQIQNISNSENQVDCIFEVEKEMHLTFSLREIYKIYSSQFSDSSKVVLPLSSRVNSLIREGEVLENGRQIDNILYLFFSNGLLIEDKWVPYPKGFTLERFHSNTLDDENGFFIGTANGLLYFNKKKENFSIISAISVPVFDLIWNDSDQKIWIGTEKGIILFDPYSNEIQTSINQSNSNLTSESISSLYQSNDGLIWVGTANGGINIYDPQKDRFKFIQIKNQPVWSSYVSDSSIWIGANDNLYHSKLTRAVSAETFAESSLVAQLNPILSNGTRITCIEKHDEHTMLMGTSGNGLLLIDIETKKLLKNIIWGQRNADFITSITYAYSDIWVTTQNGLYQLDRDFQVKKICAEGTGDGFQTNYFMASYMDGSGNIWIGSNTGISIIYPDSIRHILYNKQNLTKSPGFNFVTGFHEDYLGRIWMSTFGGGVSCLNVTTDRFFHIKKDNGLANNVCASIVGNRKQVFIGTNEGLSKINVESLEITNYTKSDGLIANEFAISSVSKNDDEFLFGTVDGLVIFNENALNEEVKFRQPTITNLSINYEKVSLSRMEASMLDLYPKDQIFSFEFSDLSFRNRDKICYEYKMTGFNEYWIKANSANRRATYSLSPGSYAFEVRTVNGAKKSEPTLLSIVVHPAFYKTWWFLILVGISLVLATFFASRYYSHQLLKKKLRELEVQQKIQNERERISRDLHDNVGSQITYIATSLDNYSTNANPEEMKELGEFTRETMRQLRETIWVINNDEVSIDELKTKVVDYLSEVLRNFPDIIHDVNFPKSDLTFNPTKAINIFRIIQEGVNNAIKHAEPLKLEVNLVIGEENSITISDDGKGFSGEDKSGHFGLMNMRSRAQEIGGSFQLKSSPGFGTSIIVSGFKIGQMT